MESDKIFIFKDTLQEIHGILEEVKAIETLEYHNANHLAFDNPKRANHKISLLTHAIETIEAYVKRPIFI